MNPKSNCVGPQREGQVERSVKAPSGRRKFLTTVAGAGAAALLVSRGAHAQEGGGYKDPFDSSTPAKERMFSSVNPWVDKDGKKKISRKQVEALVENAKKQERVGGSSFAQGTHIGSRPLDMYDSSNFKYSAKEEGQRVFFEIKNAKGRGSETILFSKEEGETFALSRFHPQNPRVEDEFVVLATRKRIVVWFLDSAFKKPVVSEFKLCEPPEVPKVKQPVAGSGPELTGAWGLPNPGKDSSAPAKKTESAKIGYENKDGVITAISVFGDKTLMVSLSKEGDILSSALEIDEKLGGQVNAGVPK